MSQHFAPGQRTLGGEVPEVRWLVGDDLCDCVFQRIGDWTNPYIGRTQRIRICCVWSELLKDYPEFVQEIPAYHDESTDLYETTPREWDGEDDMPASYWHRQMAVMMGIPVSDARELLQDQTPPKGIKRPVQPPVQRQPMSAEEIIGRQLIQLEELDAQLSATVSVIHMLKNGTVTLDQIELHDAGFTVNDFEQATAEANV